MNYLDFCQIQVTREFDPLAHAEIFVDLGREVEKRWKCFGVNTWRKKLDGIAPTKETKWINKNEDVVPEIQPLERPVAGRCMPALASVLCSFAAPFSRASLAFAAARAGRTAGCSLDRPRANQ